MACTLSSVKRQKTNEAMDVFQGNAASIRLNKENNTAIIRWGNDYKVKTHEQAIMMIRQKMDKVLKWSKSTFNRSFPEWVRVDGQDPGKITVKFSFPRDLETAYAIDLAKEGDIESISEIAKNPFRYGVPGSRPKDTTPPTMAQLSTDGKTIKKGLDDIVLIWLQNNKIEVKENRDYSKTYEARTGKKLTAVAYANILDRTIEYFRGHRDGTTLIEEAMHFVTYHMWETPEFKALREATTPGGTRWLNNTQEWKDHYAEYVKFYRDTQQREDWEMLVEQEIVTKVLANYIYEEYKSGGLNPTKGVWASLVRNVVKFLRKLFRLKNPNGGYQFDLPSEVKSSLGTLGEKFMKGALSIPMTTAEEATQPFLKLYSGESMENLVGLTYQRLIRRKEKLLLRAKSLYNSQMKKKHVALAKKYDIETVEQLARTIETLMEAQRAGTLTATQAWTLNELKSLRELFDRSEEDQRLANEIKNINDNIAIVNKQIKDLEHQRAVQTIINGIVFLDENDAYDVKGSLKSEARKITEKIDSLLASNADTRPFAYPTIIKAMDFLEEFGKMVEELNILANDEMGREQFSDLTAYEKDELFQNIRDTNAELHTLSDKLAQLWNKVGLREAAELSIKDASGDNMFDLTPEELMAEPQMDIWEVSRFLGSKVDMAPWQIQKMMELYASNINRTHRNTTAAANDIFELIYEDRKSGTISKHPTVKKYMAQFGLSRPEQLIGEMDPKTNLSTGYFIGEWEVGPWTKSKDKWEEYVWNKLEKFIKDTYGTEVKIPRDDSQESKEYRAKLIYDEDISFLGELNRIQNRSDVANYFNYLWAEWYKMHTQPRPDYEDIVSDRRSSL
jgi:hypothetical protein